MDFVVGLLQISRKSNAIWVIVDRLTNFAHFIPVGTTYSLERLAEIYIHEIFDPGEARLLVTEFVQDAFDKVKLIQDRLRTTQSRKKSYTNRKVRDVSYMVGEKVLLRVSPMMGVMRFEKKGKLSPQYIGSFEVLDRIGEVAFKLVLLPSLSSVHPVFHVSMLRKYVGDPSHVFDFRTVQLDGDLTYNMESVAILDWHI
ncbi:uncharacterized protein [Nicotiana sylvestris]|uniref:uncharacterized protein n=1 Tax=Nicotiana sylvestris TaxID=4096 RepID=UPI00388C9764